MLRPAPNGLDHLVGLGRGQHEDHVVGRLLERLEQGVLGTRCEHVHLVQEVHLGATGRAERHLAQQVADVVDLVVGRGVEFVQVERGPGLDRDTRLALAAGLAIGRIRAVQHLGQDAGSRGLAGAPRAAQEVGVMDPTVASRVPEGCDHMLLAPDLTEPSGPVAAVERRVLHVRPSLQPDHDTVGGWNPRCHPAGPVGGSRLPSGHQSGHQSGGSGIRTHGDREATHAFQACRIVRSRIPPGPTPRVGSGRQGYRCATPVLECGGRVLCDRDP